MATEQLPQPCNCCPRGTCPAPTQQRQVRTLGNYFCTIPQEPGGGGAPPSQACLTDALSILRQQPWRAASGTAISYCYTVGANVYMSESRARWIVPEKLDDMSTNTQTYARYQIDTFYNGGSGTSYTSIGSQTETWNGPGGPDVETRATPWVELLIDDWAVYTGSSLDHRGFISRMNYTCYPSDIWE